MAITELSLLSNFLLPPAPLAVSLTLQQFAELFPKARQNDPTITHLYNELQKQRAQDIERVKQNLAAEVRHGESQQRHIKRIRQARLRQELGSEAVELTMEAQLFPERASDPHREPHSMESAVDNMRLASTDLDETIIDLEKETASVMAELQTIVGDLSDLRYGRLSKTPGADGGDLSTEVLECLQRIRQLCGAEGD